MDDASRVLNDLLERLRAEEVPETRLITLPAFPVQPQFLVPHLLGWGERAAAKVENDRRMAEWTAAIAAWGRARAKASTPQA